MDPLTLHCTPSIALGRVVLSDRPLSVLVIERDGLLYRRFAVEMRASLGLVSCADTRLGLQLVRSRRFDLILIGSLESADTPASLCVGIRCSSPNSDTPVLVLGTGDDDNDVTEALDGGADDYVATSVGRDELMARVRALLRRQRRAPRTTENGTSLLSYRGITMDLARRRVQVGASDIYLTSKEFQILAALLRSSGSVVTRDTLLREVWNGVPFVNPRNLDAVVKRLRQKLAAAKNQTTRIATVRGFGFRIVETWRR